MDFAEGTVDTTAVEVAGAGEFSRQRRAWTSPSRPTSRTWPRTLTDTTGDPQGQLTGASRPAWPRPTPTVWPTTCTSPPGRWTAARCASACTKNLNGYAAAGIRNHRLLLDQQQQQRSRLPPYVFAHHEPSRTPRATPTPCTLEDQFDRPRSATLLTAYTKQDRCASGLKSCDPVAAEPTATDLVEYGYLRSFTAATTLAGETVMMDAPFMYLRAGSHNWNGSTWISTASTTTTPTECTRTSTVKPRSTCTTPR